MGYRIILSLMGIGILIGTGWIVINAVDITPVEGLWLDNILKGFSGQLQYGEIIFDRNNFNLADKSYYFGDDLIAFKINEVYYCGLYNSHIYFDSIFLEWLGLGLGGIFLSKSLFGNYEK